MQRYLRILCIEIVLGLSANSLHRVYLPCVCQRGEVGSTKIDIARLGTKFVEEGAWEFTVNVFGLRPVRLVFLLHICLHVVC